MNVVLFVEYSLLIIITSELRIDRRSREFFGPPLAPSLLSGNSLTRNVCFLLRQTACILLLVLAMRQLGSLLIMLNGVVIPNNEPSRPYGETYSKRISISFERTLGWNHLPRSIVLTASGTLPPCQSRVLMPKEIAWAKLSCPRRIPENRAKSYE